MLPVKVASKSLYETSADSLFASLLTPMLLAAHGIAMTVTVTLPRLFCVFPHSFRGKERLFTV